MPNSATITPIDAKQAKKLEKQLAEMQKELEAVRKENEALKNSGRELTEKEKKIAAWRAPADEFSFDPETTTLGKLQRMGRESLLLVATKAVRHVKYDTLAAVTLDLVKKAVKGGGVDGTKTVDGFIEKAAEKRGYVKGDKK